MSSRSDSEKSRERDVRTRENKREKHVSDCRHHEGLEKVEWKSQQYVQMATDIDVMDTSPSTKYTFLIVNVFAILRTTSFKYKGHDNFAVGVSLLLANI